ncbi:MAG: hypothetical protein WAT78_06010 [Rhizobiaceae bacterium]
MPGILLSALFSCFTMVRIAKGPWMRNPQYLAVSLVGSVLAMLALNAYSPGMADEFVAGTLAAMAGAYAGIAAFDLALGGE